MAVSQSHLYAFPALPLSCVPLGKSHPPVSRSSPSAGSGGPGEESAVTGILGPQ